MILRYDNIHRMHFLNKYKLITYHITVQVYRSTSQVQDLVRGLKIQLSQILWLHQFPQMPSFRLVSITEPGLFQPTLATVRKTAQDLIGE